MIVLRRPGHPWPLLLAANRDERLDRPWDPPGPWWPGIVGGRDRTAGGTWMAINEAGVVATVLNRPGSLGPSPGVRTRGDLPIVALAAGSARAAAVTTAALPAGAWRPFNMVLCDREDALFLRGLGAGHAEVTALPAGITMVTAHDPNDLASPRVARHLPRFRVAAPPSPESDDWSGWEALLADATGAPTEALRVPATDGFGTVCSSLLALGADGARIWRFADRPTGLAPFRSIPL